MSEPRSVSFKVFGVPGAQGSKNGRAVYKGKGADREFTGKIAQVENSKKVAPWRSDVKAAAEEAVGNDWQPISGPCAVGIRFIFQRPKNHYGTGRNAAVLKPWAPLYVTGHNLGDIDKLVRSTLDAMTSAGVYTDDALVVRFLEPTEKVYGVRGGAEIYVQELIPDD